MVRRCVGYNRYGTARELDLLNQLWPLASTMTNLFIPQQKLASKTRVAAKVTRPTTPLPHPTNGSCATTPKSSTPLDRKALALRLAQADPAAIREQIALIQANLLQLARRRGQIERKAKRKSVYLSRTKLDKRES